MSPGPAIWAWTCRGLSHGTDVHILRRIAIHFNAVPSRKTKFAECFGRVTAGYYQLLLKSSCACVKTTSWLWWWLSNCARLHWSWGDMFMRWSEFTCCVLEQRKVRPPFLTSPVRARHPGGIPLPRMAATATPEAPRNKAGIHRPSHWGRQAARAKQPYSWCSFYVIYPPLLLSPFTSRARPAREGESIKQE